MSRAVRAEIEALRYQVLTDPSIPDCSRWQRRWELDSAIVQTMAESFAPKVGLGAFQHHWKNPNSMAVLANVTLLTGGAGQERWPLAAVCECLALMRKPDLPVQTRQAQALLAAFKVWIPWFLKEGGMRLFLTALENQLSSQLPADLYAQYQACRLEPDTATRIENMIKLLLDPPGAARHVAAKLTDDDAVLEALSIIWLAAPLTCVPFARELSALLAVSNDPERLVREMEAALLERLDFSGAELQEYRALVAAAPIQHPGLLAARLKNELGRIGTTPEKRPRPAQQQPGTAGQSPAQREPDPATAAFNRITRWLTLEQVARREARRLPAVALAGAALVDAETAAGPALQIVEAALRLASAGVIRDGEVAHLARRMGNLWLQANDPG